MMAVLRQGFRSHKRLRPSVPAPKRPARSIIHTMYRS